MSDLDSGLYSDGTTGWSGSSTSAERAVRETLSPRRQQVYDLIVASGRVGMTCAEVQQALAIGHGSASGALTILHRGGHIRRLTQRRGRQEVYVLPEHINGREESPYRPNSGKARIAALERQNAALADDLAAHHQVLREVTERLSSARQASDDLAHILGSGYAVLEHAYEDIRDVQRRLAGALGTNRSEQPRCGAGGPNDWRCTRDRGHERIPGQEKHGYAGVFW